MVGIIVDVIVHQGGRVNQFKGKRKRHHLVLLGASCETIRQEKQERSKAFAPRIEHASRFQSDLASTQGHLVVNEILEGLIDLFAHGFQRGLEDLDIAAHTPPTTEGFLTGRPRP